MPQPNESIAVNGDGPSQSPLREKAHLIAMGQRLCRLGGFGHFDRLKELQGGKGLRHK